MKPPTNLNLHSIFQPKSLRDGLLVPGNPKTTLQIPHCPGKTALTYQPSATLDKTPPPHFTF